ncbi:MAG: methylmalonyl-CoA epimerase [Actinomycetota bacterium]|nr:methylmalonyl-CoA epimerase [Actinomycetota bacterium]
MDLVQVAQHADDLDRAAEFYTRLTGTGPAGWFDPPGLLFFDLGGVRLLLERPAASATLYLRVASVRQRVDELRALGVTVVGEPQVIFTHPDDRLGPVGTVEWQAFIRDSEGNLVGLVSQEPDPG